MEVVGNTIKFKITSPYGARESFRTHPHTGMDVNFPSGTGIHSVHSGVVEKVVNYGDENLGKGIFVKGENGETTIYGHMRDISISEGQRVSEGTMIGHSGSTGHSTGPHLHFAEKNAEGNFVDPTHHFEQLTAMSANSVTDQSNWFLDSVNSFSDYIINKEVEFIFKPIGIGIKNMAIDLFWYIQTNIPEIMGSITLLAAALIILGFRIPKVTSIYGVSLIIAAFWRSAT
ncbi:M23 family metallopeptidase [Metabacillus sp. B2-18]|uniref:M23 family metallopeptidase n=1 Tax=Metabacillus sp. B2-18 TaxID=2897333 RepID=UPI001E6549D4|nr:M23 family metallopeptidase [Metabacillus sp. B2-18]UGB31726.1 M23 family metallopeptidase [Metabacillus sp. B2-18]